MSRAAGPLGRVLSTADPSRWTAEANPLVLMRRVAFIDSQGRRDDPAQAHLLHWAVEHRLGQHVTQLDMISGRRAEALSRLAKASHGAREWVRLLMRPTWRMAVGLGDRRNPHEIGIALHGTYGWPVIPGSSLKGLTCAWAVACGVPDADPQQFASVFGTPRPSGPPTQDAEPTEQQKSPADGGPEQKPAGAAAQRGSVVFFDAMPAGEPVTVVTDVLTPHVQPYYSDNPQPPAEYHNPIPAQFLAVSGGAFAVDLLGPTDDVRAAADWCREAVDELGVGAKTSSGYGYLSAQWEQEPDR